MNNQDVGFYLLDINATDKKQEKILTAINDFSIKKPYDNVVLFNNQFNRIETQRKYYTLHIQQAKYFSGLLFVFDLKSCLLTRTFPSPKKQILYIDKAEWADAINNSYTIWKDIYDNDRIELVTSNQELYDICSICWKKPLHIMTDINGQEIYNVVTKL